MQLHSLATCTLLSLLYHSRNKTRKAEAKAKSYIYIILLDIIHTYILLKIILLASD